MARGSKFVSSVSKDVAKQCKIIMLIKVMDISLLMVHAKQIKKED